MGAICETYGVNVVRIEVENGKAVNPDVLNETIQRETDAKAVFATLSETSTGVVHDIESIAKVVKGNNLLLVVDGISGSVFNRSRWMTGVLTLPLPVLKRVLCCLRDSPLFV